MGHFRAPGSRPAFRHAEIFSAGPIGNRAECKICRYFHALKRRYGNTYNLFVVACTQNRVVGSKMKWCHFEKPDTNVDRGGAMGTDCAEATGRARRQPLAPHIAAPSVAGISARPAGRRPCGRRSRVEPGVASRNGLKRREIAASLDLHPGLAGRLGLRGSEKITGRGQSLPHHKVAEGPEALAAPRNHSAAQRYDFARPTDKTERTEQ